MDAAWAAWALVAAAATLWATLWASRRRADPRSLSAMPGPFAVPLLGNAFLMVALKRNEIFAFTDALTRKFWPLFITWVGTQAEVHICDADHAEVILHNTTNIDKSPFYDFLHPWLGTGLLTSSGRKWHLHRKIITPAFHFTILENFFNIFVEKSQLLVKKLEQEIDNPVGFDVHHYITLCTLDIICETAMGTEINAQENAHSPYVSAIHAISESTFARMIRPWYYSDFVFYLSKAGRKYKKDLGVLHGFTDQIIRERREALSNQPLKEKTREDVFGKKKRMAFLDLLIEGFQGETLTNEEIREEVDTFMFEGHDTISTSICWTLLLLGSHVHVQTKVYQELQQIFQGSDRPPTMKDLSEMKYLERVIKESLRLYPSVPFIGRRITEETEVGEYILPVGALITLHIYHVHRNPKYFPNPDEFNPDNFLPERVQGRHPYAYIPFSAGSRNCMGQKFAMLEAKTVLSYIVRNYEVRSLRKPADVTLLGELVLRPEGGIRLTLGRRDQQQDL